MMLKAVATGQGANSAAIRQSNKRVMLTLLRRLGAASKADMARSAMITQNAAGEVFDELESQKLIRAVGKRKGQRGQPATLYCLDSEGAYSIGIKLGRRSLVSLLMDFSGRVLDTRSRERAFPGPEEALGLVLEDISRLRETIPAAALHRLTGIGLAMPSNCGSLRRELDIPAEVVSAWDGFDLANELRASVDEPVFLENDGTAIAIAELFQGHGRELDDFVVMYVGTALGGGLVLNGDCRRGVTGNAGDVGLIPVPPSRLASAPKPDKDSDILLTRASVGSLIRHLRLKEVDIRTGYDLESAIGAFPNLVDEWLEDCADALVDPLLTMSSMLDLQAIIIDGNLPRNLVENLISRLRVLLERAVPEARRPPVLRIGTLGQNAAAIGAAILPLHYNFAAIAPSSLVTRRLVGRPRPVIHSGKT